MRCPGIHGLVSCVNSPVEESHPNVLPSSVNAKTCAATPGAAASSCTASRPARRESKSTATSRIGLDEISPAGMCTHEATRVLASRGGLILWWTLFTLPATVGVDIFVWIKKKKTGDVLVYKSTGTQGSLPLGTQNPTELEWRTRGLPVHANGATHA